ncbi:sulfonate dioxygenase [Kwoniella mangroviensis CBS 10435]|uniref:Sulfonate dioxygenase n=1 Tax=Kwoniella mangroviensis CBS 10435 TaxID=1331196 RepID=A0A1B9IIC5_9TREE|nr:sulfonate dioxygenase [Kwoniella mangroviensis CBS 10435]
MPIKVANNFDSKGRPFHLAKSTRERLENAGLDISKGYPYYPDKPKDLDAALRKQAWEFRDPGVRADREKKALLSAAKEVNDLSPHLGTEIIGLQLSEFTDQQKDELGLLIVERTVVFFRDQNITPQEQLELGKWYGVPEVHPTAARVHKDLPGVTIISDEIAKTNGLEPDYKSPFGTQNWHTDLTHEPQPPGVTHLHLDHLPGVGGDTLWASGYAAFDKLSPAFQKLIEPLEGLYRSVHSYTDLVTGKQSPIINAHPIVRVNPATGWKALFVNSRFTVGIKGLEYSEAQAILQKLFQVYEQNTDIQIRFKWTPRTSALWDNRISVHSAVYDYLDEVTDEPRHGTRVSSLAERPISVAEAPNAVSRREALGLPTGKVYEQYRDTYHS